MNIKHEKRESSEFLTLEEYVPHECGDEPEIRL